jgi:hypothetical protein
MPFERRTKGVGRPIRLAVARPVAGPGLRRRCVWCGPPPDANGHESKDGSSPTVAGRGPECCVRGDMFAGHRSRFARSTPPQTLRSESPRGRADRLPAVGRYFARARGPAGGPIGTDQDRVRAGIPARSPAPVTDDVGAVPLGSTVSGILIRTGRHDSVGAGRRFDPGRQPGARGSSLTAVGARHHPQRACRRGSAERMPSWRDIRSRCTR